MEAITYVHCCTSPVEELLHYMELMKQYETIT